MVADGHPIIHTEADLSHNLFLLHPFCYTNLFNIKHPPTIISHFFKPCFLFVRQIITQIRPLKSFKAVEQLCTRMCGMIPRNIHLFHIRLLPLLLFGELHAFPVILTPPRAKSLNPVIDLCWVTLFFPPIRPLWGVMTWKWIDELPALIPLLKPGHYQIPDMAFHVLPG